MASIKKSPKSHSFGGVSFSVFRLVENAIFSFLLSRMTKFICLSVAVLLNTLCWRLLYKTDPVINIGTV